MTFTMNGKYGVLEYMKKRIEQNGICVIVVAEGAGQVCSSALIMFTQYNHHSSDSFLMKMKWGGLQELLEGVGGSDASGNPILGDFGKWFTGKVYFYFFKTFVAPFAWAIIYFGSLKENFRRPALSPVRVVSL